METNSPTNTSPPTINNSLDSHISNYVPNAAPMNPEKISEMNMETEGAPPKIDKELLAARAYEIWEQDGCEEGNDIRNWLQAEGEFRTGRAVKSTS